MTTKLTTPTGRTFRIVTQTAGQNFGFHATVLHGNNRMAYETDCWGTAESATAAATRWVQKQA